MHIKNLLYLISNANPQGLQLGLVQDWSHVPMQHLVPVLEELLEDDGLLSLWQDLHLQHNKQQLVTARL